jgi:hypothetical protein
MASNDRRPINDFVSIVRRSAPTEGHGTLEHNSNHDKPTLGLPPGSDRLGPTELRALFAEWRADYAAGKEGLEPPALPSTGDGRGIDIDEPER